MLANLRLYNIDSLRLMLPCATVYVTRLSLVSRTWGALSTFHIIRKRPVMRASHHALRQGQNSSLPCKTRITPSRSLELYFELGVERNVIWHWQTIYKVLTDFIYRVENTHHDREGLLQWKALGLRNYQWSHAFKISARNKLLAS